jgi:hypothetical protein
MGGYGSWDDERERILNSLEDPERGEVAELLDHAASAAAGSNLNGAAWYLAEARRRLVGMHVFRRWDDGILVFSGIIRLVRGMSPETAVPRAFQRLLDSIPSLRYDVPMSRRQRVFWYGEAQPARPGEIPVPDRGEVMMSGIVVAVIVIVWLLLR